MRFTRHGTWEMVLGTVMLVAIGIGLSFLWRPLGFVVLPIVIWLWAFFRDPERPITNDCRAMVSPADGLVSDVSELDACELVGGGPAVRIGIFLSVFNVHVNRSPCDGVVSDVVYKKGKFINALSHAQASSDNESNTIVLLEPGTRDVVCAVKQIVGLIARRIICTSKPGDTVRRGERIGMIKFGSRTELYIPKRLGPNVLIKSGTKVRGGVDILATVNRDVSCSAAAAGSTSSAPAPAVGTV
jgi:phosphatidylserine decarboxylase